MARLKWLRGLKPPHEDEDSFPDGIKILHDPPNATVDICFVHGLTGNRESTWTSPGETVPWPKTLLPVTIRTARILTYGYDAYVLRRSVSSSGRLRDHSLNLLNDLATDRMEGDRQQRPIIFVAHSLGGLVCKEAILLSRNHPESFLQSIFTCVKGIIFMGTPHTGSWMAKWAMIPARSLGIVKSTNLSLLGVLQEDDQFLESIQYGFLEMLRWLHSVGRQIEVTCFFEELPLPLVGTVVPKSSATFPGYNLISIHADHRNMVKFASSEDNGYKRLLGVLSRWTDDSSRNEERPTSEHAFRPHTTALESPSDEKLRRNTTNDLRHHIDQSSPDPCLPPFQNKKRIYFPDYEADKFNFIERSEIYKIEPHFKHVERSKGSANVILYGMGGSGKTQLALYYCRQAQALDSFGGALFVDGASLATIRESFLMAAKEMLSISVQNLDPETAVDALFNIIADSGLPWVFVLDNLDDLGAYDVDKFLPKRGYRLIIITSRRTEARLLGHAIKVGNLEQEEALTLLFGKNCAGQSESATAAGRQLVERLGCLALAIAQASAFIMERNIEPEYFLGLYEAEKRKIQAVIPQLWQYSRRQSNDKLQPLQLSIASTWEMSLALLSGDGDTTNAKARLLLVSAFLGRSSVSECLFGAYIKAEIKIPAWMEIFTRQGRRELDTYAFREAIAEMGRLSLLQSYRISINGATWQLHPVVQDWAQSRQEKSEWEYCALLALDVLRCSLHDYESARLHQSRETVQQYQGIRHHVDACYKNCQEITSEELTLGSPRTADAALKMANFFVREGRYEPAGSLLQAVVNRMPSGSRERKAALRHLANSYYRQQDFASAARLQEQAVQSRVEGRETKEDAYQMLELAQTYRSQSLYTRESPEANKKVLASLELVSKALSIMHHLAGDESLEVASALHVLAEVEYQLGNFAKSVELEHNVISIRTKLLGERSYATLEAQNNLAIAYVKLGDCAKAAAMHEEVGDIQMATLGEGHPDTLRTQKWLARAWRLGGHHQKAKALNERILQLTESTLGRSHPDTKSAAGGLWRCLVAIGLLVEAANLQQEHQLQLSAVDQKTLTELGGKIL